MLSIIYAETQHLDELTKMGMDLWPDNDFEELKKDFFKIINKENGKIFLSFENDTPIGFLYVSIRSDYVEGTKSRPTGYVEGIYVNPNYRRKGLSKQLLLEGEKWLKEKGCKQIGSDIEIDNQQSYHFHTATGFKEANRLIAFIKDIK
jgi:aminoglycoside 6'-N-acetyltransferase I